MERQPNCNCRDFARCEKRSYAFCLKHGHTCINCDFDINKKRIDKFKSKTMKKSVSIPNCSIEYPELDEIANNIRLSVLGLIRDEAPKIESKMPYKQQCILELLISKLERDV